MGEEGRREGGGRVRGKGGGEEGRRRGEGREGERGR